MNVPVGARIDQLRVNLERGRWVLHEIKGEFVLVDVAGFDVAYFRDDEPIWTSKVVVGRPYRETPVFKSEITYVVLKPTWTIPPGILAKDTRRIASGSSTAADRRCLPRPWTGTATAIPFRTSCARIRDRTTRSGSSRSCFRILI